MHPIRPSAEKRVVLPAVVVAAGKEGVMVPFEVVSLRQSQRMVGVDTVRMLSEL